MSPRRRNLTIQAARRQAAPDSAPTSIPIARPDGVIVGEVRAADAVFQTQRRGSQHFLRRPVPAIAFDVGVLDRAEAAGARTVEVYDAERGLTYRAPLARVRAEGFPVRRGWGDQWALPLRRFNTGDEADSDQPPAEQIGLW